MEADEGWGEVSEPGQDFVRRLIEPDVSKRMTAKEALQHPWLVGGLADPTKSEENARRLIAFNARRKLKAGMQTALAGVAMTNRLHRSPRREEGGDAAVLETTVTS
jgi:calcium/calmodulin-dependent protein kinase I